MEVMSKLKLTRTAVLLVIFTGVSCTSSTVVHSRYVISTADETAQCPYTWHTGDYWEFLAWAILDDPGAASALAITAGYAPEAYPSPGTVITLPLSSDYAEAAENRMEAARLVREATETRLTDRNRCMELLRQAARLDPAWSVPVTDITVLLLEDGRTEEALALLAPLAHKNSPAMVRAGIAWRQGDTQRALEHLAEALAADNPRPEVLAAAGIAWSVTGDLQRAGAVLRRLLENPDAPSELRIQALHYAIMLGER